jgi:hypothetical protein
MFLNVPKYWALRSALVNLYKPSARQPRKSTKKSLLKEKKGSEKSDPFQKSLFKEKDITEI